MPFRFSFETDQQYQARTQGSAPVAQAAPPPASAVPTSVTSTTNAQPTSANVSTDSTSPVVQTVQASSVPAHVVQPPANGTFMSIPLWMIVIFILLVTLSVYETSRRELRKALAEALASQPPRKARPQKRTPLQKRYARFVRTARKKLPWVKFLSAKKEAPIFHWHAVPDNLPTVARKEGV